MGPNCSARDCHAGYCDRSIGHCICLPGWQGARCSFPFLAACRMSLSGLSAPCEGFAGVMSCQCRRDCAALHAVYGASKKPFSSADKAPCWTSNGGNELLTSSLPWNRSAVRFWALHRTHRWELPAHFQSVVNGLPAPAGLLQHNRHSHGQQRYPLRSKSPRVTVAPPSWRQPTQDVELAEIELNSTVRMWGKSDFIEGRQLMLRLQPDDGIRFVPNTACPGKCSNAGIEHRYSAHAMDSTALSCE